MLVLRVSLDHDFSLPHFGVPWLRNIQPLLVWRTILQGAAVPATVHPRLSMKLTYQLPGTLIGQQIQGSVNFLSSLRPGLHISPVARVLPTVSSPQS